MKNKQLKRMRPILFVAMIIAMLTGNTFGQSQKEHYGQEAAQLIPGARMVLEGLHTNFPAYVIFEEEKAIPEG